MNQTLMTLDQLAAEVNAWLDCAKVAEDQACASRISVGKILAEAKDRVRTGEPGHKSWAKWVRQHLKRSYREVNNCIAALKTPDDMVARKTARAIARKASAQSRENASQTFEPRADEGHTLVSPELQTTEVNGAALTLGRLKRDALSLSAKDRTELTEWLASGNEVQRDRHGNVLDPLPVRLKRVLHRLRKTGRPGNFGHQTRSFGADEFDHGLRELEEIVHQLNEYDGLSTGPRTCDSALSIG